MSSGSWTNVTPAPATFTPSAPHSPHPSITSHRQRSITPHSPHQGTFTPFHDRSHSQAQAHSHKQIQSGSMSIPDADPGAGDNPWDFDSRGRVMGSAEEISNRKHKTLRDKLAPSNMQQSLGSPRSSTHHHKASSPPDFIAPLPPTVQPYHQSSSVPAYQHQSQAQPHQYQGPSGAWNRPISQVQLPIAQAGDPAVPVQAHPYPETLPRAQTQGEDWPQSTGWNGPPPSITPPSRATLVTQASFDEVQVFSPPSHSPAAPQDRQDKLAATPDIPSVAPLTRGQGTRSTIAPMGFQAVAAHLNSAPFRGMSNVNSIQAPSARIWGEPVNPPPTSTPFEDAATSFAPPSATQRPDDSSGLRPHDTSHPVEHHGQPEPLARAPLPASSPSHTPANIVEHPLAAPGPPHGDGTHTDSGASVKVTAANDATLPQGDAGVWETASETPSARARHVFDWALNVSSSPDTTPEKVTSAPETPPSFSPRARRHDGRIGREESIDNHSNQADDDEGMERPSSARPERPATTVFYSGSGSESSSPGPATPHAVTRTLAPAPPQSNQQTASSTPQIPTQHHAHHDGIEQQPAQQEEQVVGPRLAPLSNTGPIHQTYDPTVTGPAPSQLSEVHTNRGQRAVPAVASVNIATEGNGSVPYLDSEDDDNHTNATARATRDHRDPRWSENQTQVPRDGNVGVRQRGRRASHGPVTPYWKTPPSALYSPMWADRRLLVEFPFPINATSAVRALNQNFSRYGPIRNALWYERMGENCEKAVVVFKDVESLERCLADPGSREIRHQSAHSLQPSTFEVNLVHQPPEAMTRVVFVRFSGPRSDQSNGPRSSRAQQPNQMPSQASHKGDNETEDHHNQGSEEGSAAGGYNAHDHVDSSLLPLPEKLVVVAVPLWNRFKAKYKYHAKLVTPGLSLSEFAREMKVNEEELRVLDEISLSGNVAEKDIIPRLCDYFAELASPPIPPTNSPQGWLITVGGPNDAKHLMDELGKIPGVLTRWANYHDGYHVPSEVPSDDPRQSPLGYLERQIDGGYVERNAYRGHPGPPSLPPPPPLIPVPAPVMEQQLPAQQAAYPSMYPLSPPAVSPQVNSTLMSPTSAHNVHSVHTLPPQPPPAPTIPVMSVPMSTSMEEQHHPFLRPAVLFTYKSRALEEVVTDDGEVHYVDKAAIFVGRLVKSLETKETLLKRFSRYGKICDIEYNPLSARATYATARILFQSVDAAQRAIKHEAGQVSFGSGIKVEERRVLPMDVQTKDMFLDHLDRPVSPSMVSQYSPPPPQQREWADLSPPPPLPWSQTPYPTYPAYQSLAPHGLPFGSGFTPQPPVIFGYGPTPYPTWTNMSPPQPQPQPQQPLSNEEDIPLPMPYMPAAMGQVMSMPPTPPLGYPPHGTLPPTGLPNSTGDQATPPGAPVGSVIPMIQCMGQNYYPYPVPSAAYTPSLFHPFPHQAAPNLSPPQTPRDLSERDIENQSHPPSQQQPPQSSSTQGPAPHTATSLGSMSSRPSDAASGDKALSDQYGDYGSGTTGGGGASLSPSKVPTPIKIDHFVMKNGNYTPVYDPEDLKRYCREHGLQSPGSKTLQSGSIEMKTAASQDRSSSGMGDSDDQPASKGPEDTVATSGITPIPIPFASIARPESSSVSNKGGGDRGLGSTQEGYHSVLGSNQLGLDTTLINRHGAPIVDPARANRHFGSGPSSGPEPPSSAGYHGPVDPRMASQPEPSKGTRQSHTGGW